MLAGPITVILRKNNSSLWEKLTVPLKAIQLLNLSLLMLLQDLWDKVFQSLLVWLMPPNILTKFPTDISVWWVMVRLLKVQSGKLVILPMFTSLITLLQSLISTVLVNPVLLHSRYRFLSTFTREIVILFLQIYLPVNLLLTFSLAWNRNLQC